MILSVAFELLGTRDNRSNPHGITGDYRKICLPNQKLSLAVSSIIEVSINKIVCKQLPWRTAELVIIENNIRDYLKKKKNSLNAMKIIQAPTFNVKKMLPFRIGLDVVGETWIEPKCI